MSLPEIRFQDIRPHENSRNIGFEELCCQLASLEVRQTGAAFFRKGRGGDAGVECFARQAGGEECGWQAKYVPGWDKSLKTQLDKSIRTALDKHPRLTEYVVCLPFDLPDSRSGKGQTPLAQWEKWKSVWIATAKREGRELDIALWDASALGERLSRDDPAYAGRLFYWFDQQALTVPWFRQQFEKSRVALKSRYVPESNVELPIYRDFLALARNASILAEVEHWSGGLRERVHSAANAIRKAPDGKAESYAENVRIAIESLTHMIDRLPLGLDQSFPLVAWRNAAQAADNAVDSALAWSYGLPEDDPKHGASSPTEWARHELLRLAGLIKEILGALESQRWQLVNVRQLLLIGEAGSGKSHLLADVVDHQIEAGGPALLILGSMLSDDEPWHQILTQLDLPAPRQVRQLLGALDAAAEAAKLRALVCIDAINERHGYDIWPHRLATFLKEVEPFPRIVICVSCRTTYVPYIVPEGLNDKVLPRIEHHGFGGTSGEAARRYLDIRGIVRPGAPNLLPEFDNPLFLKTCCDFLEKDGKTELPRGIQGVTAIFNFYIDAVSRVLDMRMKLDRYQRIVPNAIQALAEAFVRRREGYIPIADAIVIFDAIYPSRGKREDSLLAQLESEGVLTVELIPTEQDEAEEIVRFTFERFSDHAIARQLLDEYLLVESPENSFALGKPLFDLVTGDRAYRHAGVVEAIAIQLPERADVELPDMLPANLDCWVANNAFNESLLWRDQSRFTKRTLDLVSELFGNRRKNAILLDVATEPKNAFNAFHLHTSLAALSMPERDLQWSIFIVQHADNDSGPIQTLISWALHQGMDNIDDDRAELAAIALTWLLSTSARNIRDLATKALACLLAVRLRLAISLLGRFRQIDDLYVTERLFAAIYGAVLQGGSCSGLGELAKAIYHDFFELGFPPLNALLREHAAGVIQYAKWRGQLSSSIDQAKSEPPYQSPWPIEFVPESLIETYQEDYGKGAFQDSIVSSTEQHGDFGHYVIPRVVGHFSPVPIGCRLLRPEEIFDDWLAGIFETGTIEQTHALFGILDAAKEDAGKVRLPKMFEKTKFDDAEATFRATLSSDAWEDYCVRARGYLRYGLFADGGGNRTTATFNIEWARRWVCKRAHELGWTTERFGKEERTMGYSSGRFEHRIERVGKKYQWLALHELVARMADNLAFKGNAYTPEDGASERYRGARDVGLRDIDPSLLVQKTHYDGWRQWPRTWWVPAEPALRRLSPQDRLTWKNSESDVINDSSLIEVRNPKDGRHWLALHSYSHWEQSEVVEGERVRQCSTWFRMNCVVARKRDAATLERFLRGRSFIDPSNLPELRLYGDQYLGEYPWHPSFDDMVDWLPTNSWPRMPVPVRSTVAEYRRETGGYDQSIEETVELQLPAPWLYNALSLRLVNGKELAYADPNGRIIFFDPSAVQPGPQAALVDRDLFLETLERDELTAFWIIAGEKRVFGGTDFPKGWGGDLIHTFIYRLKNGRFVCHKHFERHDPDEEQMQMFLTH